MARFSQANEYADCVKNWQRSLQHFFQLPTVELSIGLLVVASVVFTLIELSLPESSPLLSILDHLNEIMTWLFVLELILRFLAIPIKRHFFQEYWLDILAVLPLLRVFRVSRITRFLRLLRYYCHR